MDEDTLRLCRRCLTRDMVGEEETFHSLREYIENLSLDIKATAEVYEERLSVCKMCDMLLSGMCRKCGCYVELRAAVKKNACPDRRWMEESNG